MDKILFGHKFGGVEVSVDKLTEGEHLVASVSYDKNGDILPKSYRPLSPIFETREQALRRFNEAVERSCFTTTVSNLVMRKE